MVLQSAYTFMTQSKLKIAIIGGGPAGLRAAEVAVGKGAEVTLFDAKASVGRKFLVAGKSGLNLTNDADFDTFHAQYSGSDFPSQQWREFLEAFDNTQLREWAAGLGVDTFVAHGGKVFPTTKKAAPLLRRWVLRLREAGVHFRMHHEWVGLRHKELIELSFLQGQETVQERFDRVILAMGGASWPETGATGKWVPILQELGVNILKLYSANCGWECAWTDKTRQIAEGQPLQNLMVRSNGVSMTGELMVTRYGFEGTPIYALGSQLRSMTEPAIEIDFKPSFSKERLIAKMESARRNFYREARLRWKLPEAAIAIIRQLHGEFDSAEALADIVKCCRIPLAGPRPLDESISTAGGVAWSELDDQLMLKSLPVALLKEKQDH